VSGAFGQAPTISFSDLRAPVSLESKALVTGTGPAVEAGQLLVVNYVGQIWRGKIFDSSFSRHSLAGFPIGLGRVIPGWDKSLVGVPVGSRMLLVIPPVDGYGKSGDAGAGITGKDTLVFVIDVVAAYSKSVAGDLNAQVITSEVNGVTVRGGLGQEPVVHVGDIPLPTKPLATIIARGSGPEVTPGLVVLQYVVVDWTTNSIVQSTRKSGVPDAEVLGQPGTTNMLDLLIGIPIGSRVLLQVSKTSTGGPYAVAVDIVAAPRST